MMLVTKSDSERVALLTKARDAGQLNHWPLKDRLEVSRLQLILSTLGTLSEQDRLTARLLVVKAVWPADQPQLV